MMSSGWTPAGAWLVRSEPVGFTLELAAKNQLRIHQLYEDSGWPNHRDWRYQSLKHGYQYVGEDTVVDANGDICDHDDCIWLLGGMVLLCERCYADAT
jgi:hypothetical protein